jgi:hypothetical protein
MVNGPALVAPAVLVAETLNVEVPLTSGVPVTAPLAASERPAGRAPDDTEKTGLGDPDAVNVNEYGTPAVPDGGAADVNAGTSAIPTVRFPVDAEPAAFDAVTTNAKFPVSLGVPDSTPAAVRSRPVGNTPLVTANVGPGEPDAANVNEYGTPILPDGGAADVKAGT